MEKKEEEEEERTRIRQSNTQSQQQQSDENREKERHWKIKYSQFVSMAIQSNQKTKRKEGKDEKQKYLLHKKRQKAERQREAKDRQTSSNDAENEQLESGGMIEMWNGVSTASAHTRARQEQAQHKSQVEGGDNAHGDDNVWSHQLHVIQGPDNWHQNGGGRNVQQDLPVGLDWIGFGLE